MRKLFYTTDGSTPDNTSTEFTTTFQVTPNTTIKAVSYDEDTGIYGNVVSVAVKSDNYVCQSPSITASPDKTTYDTNDQVTITMTKPQPETTIRYTTDGTTPTATSTEYTNSFTVSAPATIKAACFIGSLVSTVIVKELSTNIIIGVKYDFANDTATQLTRLTPATDPNGYVNATVTAETTVQVNGVGGSSPYFDAHPIYSQMKVHPVDASGNVGTALTLPITNTTDDLVVKIPKFYYKTMKVGEVFYAYIATNPHTGFVEVSERYVGRYASGGTTADLNTKSGSTPLASITRSAFRTASANKGNGWHQWGIHTLSAIKLLYIVEMADWDSQAKLGANSGTGAKQNNGGTDAFTYCTATSSLSALNVVNQYCGIENLYTNVYNFVDGVNINNREWFKTDNPADFADNTATNYTSKGTAPTSNGYISNITGQNDECFDLPTAVAGSATTKIPDYYYQTSGWVVLLVGGDYNSHTSGGLFYRDADSSSSITNTNIGSHLAKK